MFKDVPIQAWLLIAIAATAFAPAKYVYRYIAHSPSRRDITKPPEDLTWRTTRQLARHGAMLTVLISLSVFIFTSAGLQFAHSPTFWPILMVTCGGWALATVLQGFFTGRIEPFSRGFYNIYERQSQPKRFWASMTWNALMGCLFVGFAYPLYQDTPVQALRDKCYNAKDAYSGRDALSACNQLLATNPANEDTSSLMAARGSAYYQMRDYGHAKADYINAVRLDPSDSSSHYNLGLVDEQHNDDAAAVSDYTSAIRADADNADAFMNRGLIFLDTGKLDEAISDFSRAHDLKPNDAWPLANRGLGYAWRKDRTRAEQDFKMVRAIDASNEVMLRGEAVLSLSAGDLSAAVEKLSEALKNDPEDAWSLRMRASAYEQLGKQDEAYDDKDALWRLSKKSPVPEG